MNKTRIALILATVLLVLLVPNMVLNISGMDHTVSVTKDLSAWGFALALVLGWFGLYMRLWFRCQR